MVGVIGAIIARRGDVRCLGANAAAGGPSPTGWTGSREKLCVFGELSGDS